MRMRGETVGEITACARAMRAAALKLDPPYEVIDVCGTGGDGLHTFNISTAVGLRGGGRRAEGRQARQPGAVARNPAPPTCWPRWASTSTAAPERQRRALDEAGICFLFAPAHHGAMRHVAPIRAELGFRTIFNLLGPLTNPAGAKRQVVGVYRPTRWVEPLAEVLGALGAERAWVVHGGGLDELTTTGETSVAEWRDGPGAPASPSRPRPSACPRAALADLTRRRRRRRTPRPCAPCWTAQPAPYRDIVLLNAAAAFLVGDKVETLREGVELAAAVIDDGRAQAALDALVRITNEEEAAA